MMDDGYGLSLGNPSSQTEYKKVKGGGEEEGSSITVVASTSLLQLVLRHNVSRIHLTGFRDMFGGERARQALKQ